MHETQLMRLEEDLVIDH